jgi:putative spermidine/putrescine transport system ATP-binding protein
VYGDLAAVDGVDLEAKAGEFLTLLGASGSGKTTTLSIIAGFSAPTAGSVEIAGVDVTSVAPHKRNIGMVFQHYSLFPHMSVLQNVAFPLRQRSVPRKQREQRAREALDVVELTSKSAQRPHQLSGGQQQRVAIARALVFEPSLLLMDEPFGALDRGLREKMQIELRRLHKQIGVTVIFVTHDQQEALMLADRIAVFDRGRIAQCGTPVELYEHPADLHVATFLGESTLLRGTAQHGVLSTAHGDRVAVRNGVSGETTVVLRPEQLSLTTVQTAVGATLGREDRGHSPQAELAGFVRDVTYLGSDRRVEVDTSVGPVVVRTSPRAATRAGDRVLVTWDPQVAPTFDTWTPSAEKEK